MVTPPRLRAADPSRHLAGMWGAERRWTAWGEGHEMARPFVWVHAASVGEAMAVEPVLTRLRGHVGSLGAILTHTSASVREWEGTWSVDRADFLPLPIPGRRDGPVGRVLDVLRPDLIVTARGEVWPALATAARRRNIPVTIVAGALGPDARRLRVLSRTVLRRSYETVALAAVLSDQSARRWAQLGVHPEHIRVVGDPRDDLVLNAPLHPSTVRLRPWVAGRPVVVCGSLEPSECSLALGAFAEVRRHHPDLRMVVVPHETRDATATERVCRRSGLVTQTWPGPGSASPDADTVAVVVDRNGLLRSTYQFATMAYVGGGFSPGGPHSISEPAAFGVPVVVGPTASRGAESERFVGHGALLLTSRRAASKELAECWRAWLDEPARRRAAGLAGRKRLVGGAADRTAGLLARLLERGSGVGDDRT